MPDAGWYPDPADPNKERWWGGVEWTHDVRPLVVAAPPVAQLQPLLNVPGGGINPFAALDAEEARQRALNPEPAPETVPSHGYADSTPQRFGPNSHMQEYYVEPPSNGAATAGLVLSTLCVSLLGLVFSIVGLMRANAMGREGGTPIGRKRAVVGIVLAFVAPSLIGGGLLFGYPYFKSQLISAVAEREGVSSSDVVLDPRTGLPLVYDREEAEATFYESFAEEGATLESVVCPDSASMVVGKGFECSFFYAGGTHTLGVIWTSNAGAASTTVDGVAIQN